MFVIYVILLAYFTLFNNDLGRNITNITNWHFDDIKANFNDYVNIVPFKTIRLMFFANHHNYVSSWYFIKNIFGNLLMLAPLAYFLPMLFKRINYFWKFIIAIVIISIFIEFLQLLFLTGFCDIDDLLLNTAGAAVFYPISAFIIKLRKKAK